MHHRDFHLAGDGGRATIERTAENIRKTQNIIDLVRIVGAAGSDDRIGAHRLDFFRQNFRCRVGQRHHNRLVCHAGHHLRLDDATGRKTQKDIRAWHQISQCAGTGRLGKTGLVRIHQLNPALVHYANQIRDEYIFNRKTEVDDQVETGQRCSPGAGNHQLAFFDVLANHFQAIQDSGANDDRGAVLVIMKDRDFHPVAQLALDIETFRCFDVFQIDAAEGRLQRGDDID